MGLGLGLKLALQFRNLSLQRGDGRLSDGQLLRREGERGPRLVAIRGSRLELGSQGLSFLLQSGDLGR